MLKWISSTLPPLVDFPIFWEKTYGVDVSGVEIPPAGGEDREMKEQEGVLFNQK